jgi:hypothetical protein
MRRIVVGVGLGTTQLACHRNPPVVLANLVPSAAGAELRFSNVQPVVLETEWCGHHFPTRASPLS